jgi:excisionase family DNA binding protein
MVAVRSEHEMLKVSEMARVLRIGLNNAYTLCRQPGFPALRIGGQYRIPTDRLRSWIREQEQAGHARAA